MQSSFLACRWKDDLKTREFRAILIFEEMLSTTTKINFNEWILAIYKAEILPDSSIETGEVSIQVFPPVDAIWNSYNFREKILLEVKLLRRLSWFSSF